MQSFQGPKNNLPISPSPYKCPATWCSNGFHSVPSCISPLSFIIIFRFFFFSLRKISKSFKILNFDQRQKKAGVPRTLGPSFLSLLGLVPGSTRLVDVYDVTSANLGKCSQKIGIPLKMASKFNDFNLKTNSNCLRMIDSGQKFLFEWLYFEFLVVLGVFFYGASWGSEKKMATRRNGVYIIQGEISLVVSALRRNVRWSSHSHQVRTIFLEYFYHFFVVFLWLDLEENNFEVYQPLIQNVMQNEWSSLWSG